MANIDPPAGWPAVNGIDPPERLLGGVNGPLNRAIGNLTSRVKQLRLDDQNAAAALAGTAGASLLGYRQTQSTAVLRTVEARLRDAVHVKDFGAVGDGIADDAGALLNAIASGAPLDFGDARSTYRITQPLTLSAAGPVLWFGEGASILCDFPAPVQRAVFIDNVTGDSNYIGRLRVDGQNLAFTGLRVIAAPDAHASLLIDKPSIRKIKRSSTAFTEGCGIFVTGDFDVVRVTKGEFRDITMAAGAGISGVAGVNAIAIRAGSGRPRLIDIDEPYIDNVSSDDLSYTNDQDGILVWTDRSTSPTIRPTEVHITGGYYRNCLGRSIKCQVERAYIAGPGIMRDRGFTGSTILPDIDLQVGGGFVTGVTAHYDGVSNKPQSIVLVNTPDEITKDVPIGTVDGVQVTLTNGAVLQQVVMCASRGRLKNVYRTNNLSVSGTGLSYFVRLVGGVDTGYFNLALTGASGNVGTAAVWASSSSGLTVSGNVTMQNVVNTSGSDVPAMTCQLATFRPLLATGIGCFGLTEAKNATMSNTNGKMMRVPALAAEGAASGGVLRPVSFSLADGETFKFPQSFVNVNSGMIIVSVGASRIDQGIFACDSTQVTTLAGGTGITVGATTEPATGSYRMWSDATGPYISNRSGAARTFTCFMIG